MLGKPHAIGSEVIDSRSTDDFLAVTTQIADP
ncbi:hypothetical protein SDC9_156453 [bioreactor metagenome]|uniref:Uncharacterized protein n=1 Tax=bioreactor metagenome TaxID=1076179 RepID=A0A645F4A4_9ZZZZ